MSASSVCGCLRRLRQPRIKSIHIRDIRTGRPSSQMQSHRLQQFLNSVPSNLHANANQKK